MKAKSLVPLALFILVAGFLGYGLNLNPRELPSALLNKPVPQFERVRLDLPDATFSPDDMKGKVWLLNVWGSWCVACHAEHPFLMELARRQEVPLVGLNYKDKREDALQWLQRYGNPYLLTAVDLDGRVGIDLGVYGTPETFVIDKQGMIRYKHIGVVDAKVYAEVLKPLIEELERAS